MTDFNFFRVRIISALAFVTSILFFIFALFAFKQGSVLVLIISIVYMIVCFLAIYNLNRFSTQAKILEAVDLATTIFVYEPSEIALSVHTLPKGNYVYILQDVSVTGLCKIGLSNDPHRRLRDFGVKLPMNTRLIHIIKTNNMNHLETKLHHLFKDKHVNGEWYNLTVDDIEQLKTLKSVRL